MAICSDTEMVFRGEESIETLELYTSLRRDDSEGSVLVADGFESGDTGNWPMVAGAGRP